MALLALRLARVRYSVPALWREAPWLILSLLWLASIVSLRINYPFACEADFRFVVPILLPFIIASARGGALAHALLAAMTASSALFFLSL